MKKLLLSTFFLLIFIHIQQSYGQKWVQFGGHFGVNVSNVDIGTTFADSKTNAGFNGGVYVRIGKKLFVQPQVDYYSISSTLTTKAAATQSASVSEKMNYQYLNIPVYVGFNIISGRHENSNFHLLAGPAYSKILNVGENDLLITKDDINSSLYSLGGGFGFDIKFIKIDLTTQWGINDFYKNVSGSRNRMASLTLGFKI